ncbi:hypothetical protein RB595_010235 [Gaeumannomyces hyphopodioides]
MTVHIESTAQWRQVLGSSSIVITDCTCRLRQRDNKTPRGRLLTNQTPPVYADWCGPCKMIAPTFESLSTKFSKPNKIAFCKVDVDSQREIAQQYSVSAMPTFLILRNGTVIDTIRGANPPALTAAVEKAVKLAGPGGGGGSVFSSGGQRLGGGAAGGASRPQQLQRPLNWDINSLVNSIIVFLGLYFVSLFSLDPYKSAEASKYNIKNPPAPARPAGGAGQRPGAPKPAFRTLADMGGD